MIGQSVEIYQKYVSEEILSKIEFQLAIKDE